MPLIGGILNGLLGPIVNLLDGVLGAGTGQQVVNLAPANLIANIDKAIDTTAAGGVPTGLLNDLIKAGAVDVAQLQKAVNLGGPLDLSALDNLLDTANLGQLNTILDNVFDSTLLGSTTIDYAALQNLTPGDLQLLTIYVTNVAASALGATSGNFTVEQTLNAVLTGNDKLTDDDQAHTLRGGEGNDTILGNGGNDTLDGGNNDDVLDGGTGIDSLIGGNGNDTYFVDNAADKVVEVANGGSDTVNTTVNYTLAAGVEVEFLKAADPAGMIELVLTGNELRNNITGNAGANVLDGKGGADIMAGLGGNDIYYVDDASDQIREVAGGGTDTAFVKISYTIAAGLDLEVVRVDPQTGVDPITLTGNEIANTLVGNDGANTLDGGVGADILSGRKGDDVYYVDNSADQVRDYVGEGYDTVYTTTSFSLRPASEIEMLRVTDASSTTAIALSGNEFDNTLVGNEGSNTLDGGGGVDTLSGRGGNDFYVVDSMADVVREDVGGGVDTILATTSYTLNDSAEIEVLQAAVLTGVSTIRLTGNDFVNAIIGDDGANVLDGKGGSDIMTGRSGNDIYFVDNASDSVIEASGGGVDTVRTSVSYVLQAGQEIETVRVDPETGTTAINLTGNEFANTLVGNDGANILDGGTGADILSGRGGDDLYYVDNSGDDVREAIKGGVDTIYTTVSYTLQAGSEVEIVRLVPDSSTQALNLTGNEFANTLVGNDGANILDGKGGVDTLSGRGGDDTYYVDSSADDVRESVGGGMDTIFTSVNFVLGAGKEVETLQASGTGVVNITANEFSNTVIGNQASNQLNGGRGADYLTGGAGNDTFLFNTALGNGNIDHITDLSAVDDRIALSKSAFAALGVGALTIGAFKDIGAPGAVVDSTDRIIYDHGTGALFYDSDGSGSASAIQFATLDNKALLTYQDFLVTV